MKIIDILLIDLLGLLMVKLYELNRKAVNTYVDRLTIMSKYVTFSLPSA